MLVKGLPLACSGLIYAAVPSMTPICVMAALVIVGDCDTTVAPGLESSAFGSQAKATLGLVVRMPLPASSSLRPASTLARNTGRSIASSTVASGGISRSASMIRSRVICSDTIGFYAMSPTLAAESRLNETNVGGCRHHRAKSGHTWQRETTYRRRRETQEPQRNVRSQRPTLAGPKSARIESTVFRVRAATTIVARFSKRPLPVVDSAGYEGEQDTVSEASPRSGSEGSLTADRA